MESLDFYGCIYRAQDRFQEFDLIVLHDNADILRFCVCPQAENGLMFLSLQLYEFADNLLLPPKRVWHKEIHGILNCNEELMQNKLVPLLSYMFLGLFLEFPRLESDFSSSEMDECIQADIVGSMNYKQVFNSLFSAMCSFFFSTYKGLGEDVLYLDRNGKFPKILAEAQEEILLFLEPRIANRFMKFLASIRPFNDEKALTISYSSSVEGFWTIASYSPLVSLEKTRGSRIWKPRSTSRFQLLNCILDCEHIVNVRRSFVEVCLRVNSFTCEVLPYCPMNLKARILSGDVPNKPYFPAKISLRIGPEYGRGVQSISSSQSSPDPFVDIGKQKIIDWNFEQYTVNCTDAKIDWTLYDASTGKAVYNKKPPKISFCRHKTPSIYRAFIGQGVFATHGYGKPITWRLRKDLEGQTLKWIVEASIWLTYKPNSRYSETVRHDFRQVIDLKLERTSTPN